MILSTRKKPHYYCSIAWLLNTIAMLCAGECHHLWRILIVPSYTHIYICTHSFLSVLPCPTTTGSGINQKYLFFLYENQNKNWISFWETKLWGFACSFKKNENLTCLNGLPISNQWFYGKVLLSFNLYLADKSITLTVCSHYYVIVVYLFWIAYHLKTIGLMAKCCFIFV